MNDETVGAAVEEFVGLKPKMYSFLIDDNSKHRKEKGVNRNVVATISNNEYKDILLNYKCLRHSVNRVQSKDPRTGTYEINKISLSCFDDKIYIQNNGYDGSWLSESIIKKVFLLTIQKRFYVKQIVLIFSLVRKAFLPICKNIVLIFGLLEAVLFYFFCFSI